MHSLTYMTAIGVFSVGLFVTLTGRHLLRRLLGLGVFQTGIFIFYIQLGKRFPGMVPLLQPGIPVTHYSSPLPQVLMLTAIVVGVATLAVGLGLLVRHYRLGGTWVDDLKMEQEE